MKTRSHEIGCYNDCIRLKFDRHLGSTAAEVPVKFQSDWKSLNLNLMASETSRDLAARRLTVYWIEALGGRSFNNKMSHHQSLFFIYGWARYHQPMRKDFTYETSPLIGLGLAQPWNVSSHWLIALAQSWIRNPALMKSWSCKMWISNCLIALKFGRPHCICLTHCGLVTSYGDIDLSQHRLM